MDNKSKKTAENSRAQLEQPFDPEKVIRKALVNAAKADLGQALHDPEEAATCPACYRGAIATEQQEQKFLYTSGSNSVELSAIVPVRTCSDCGFQFLDSFAESARHLAVCDYLKVMPPTDIKAARKALAPSRKTFCTVSGIGQASLARWESGVQVISHAMDRYLRLLQRADNFAWLEGVLASGSKLGNAPQTVDKPYGPRAVRSISEPRALLDPDQARSRGKRFLLRPVGRRTRAA